MLNSYLLGGHMFLYKVNVQFNMLCARIKNWIVSEMDDIKIVTQQHGRKEGNTKFSDE